MGKLQLLALMIIAMLCTSSARASIIANGTFELLDHRQGKINSAFLDEIGKAGKPKWDVFDGLPGDWTGANAGIEVQTDNTVGNIIGHSPGHYIELDSHPQANTNTPSNSSMAQDIYLPGDGNYALVYWFHARTNRTNDNGIEVLLDGAKIGQTMVDDPSLGWIQQTVLLEDMTAGNYEIMFSAVGRQNTLGGFLDDVSMHHLPEPAAVAVWSVLGLVGLAIIRRRRRH